MFSILVIVLLISFLLAVFSIYKEKGSQDLNDWSYRYRQRKIKGTIVLEKGKPPKHYSSYS